VDIIANRFQIDGEPVPLVISQELSPGKVERVKEVILIEVSSLWELHAAAP